MSACKPATTEITLGNFICASVGLDKLIPAETQLSQQTLIAVPYLGAVLSVTIRDGYCARVHSGNFHKAINKASPWLGTDRGGTYTYPLPKDSIYMRISIRRTDGNVIGAEELPCTGICVTYQSNSDIVSDNIEKATYLCNTENPVLIHISDIHGDVIRAERATLFARYVNAGALLASGDLTAYLPVDWGTALTDVFSKHPDLQAFYGTGNHDSRALPPEAYEEIIHNAYYKDFPLTPEGETYYYQDLPKEQLRIISVNQQEGCASSKLGGTCYRQKQIDWLMNTLATTPAGFGVVLMCHSPELDPADDMDPMYPDFFQQVNRVYATMTNDRTKYSGTILRDIVDAFIGRTTIERDYAEGNGASPVSVKGDFTKLAPGTEFIAYFTGHLHTDSVCYVHGAACKQLLLDVTCATATYGAPGGYGKLADPSDLIRKPDDVSQDAFNAYVINRADKTVEILRIGATKGLFAGERSKMIIPYADT